MKNNTRVIKGLVIGKFYPPHRGHEYLIRHASKNCDSLVVVVCDLPSQKIPASVRVRMLKTIFPKINIISVPDIGKDEDSFAWAQYTKQFLGYTPDMVFTSENYGDLYSKYLGAEHVKLDLNRYKYPISATKIRSDVLGNIEWINKKIRKYFIPKVVVLGAESTGTTTLARDLAAHYKTYDVLEYGRFYSEIKLNSEKEWKSSEFANISRMQNNLENKFIQNAAPVLICDTNSFATELWHERYMGKMSKYLRTISESMLTPDLYILTGDEIPFVQDGTRDGEHIRHTMHLRFLEELQSRGYNYLLVTGSKEERLSLAISAIDKVIKSKSVIV